MKKLFLVISSVCVLATSAFAQKDVFYPGFQLGIKGGAAETIGETTFTNLLSPAAALDLGYQITPVFGLRLDLSGWQGKGWYATYDEGYKFNYGQAALDATFDLCNLFGGYKTRVVNPYIFAGVGGVGYFNNGAEIAKLPTDNKYWEDFTFNAVGRAGLGIDFRLSDLLSIELEAVENLHSDKFNSKTGDIFDHQIALLAGLKFNFGQAAGKKRAAEAAAAAAAAAAAQAAAAAARAEQELNAAIAAAQKAIKAAKTAIAENDFLPEDVAAINDAIKALEAAIAAKDTAAIIAGTEALNKAVADAKANKKAADEAKARAEAERLAAEKAAYEAAKAAALLEAQKAKSSNIVYYVIGKYDIRNQERYKINNLVKKLKANPELKAVLCGFADRETGTPDGNMKLSEERSNIVCEALQAAGIDASRIETYWYGDTERISKSAARNRATVLLTK